MIQIKVIDEQHEDDLTESVNDFLSELKDSEVLQIQFSTSHFPVLPEQIFSFSAMIVYRIESENEDKLSAGGD